MYGCVFAVCVGGWVDGLIDYVWDTGCRGGVYVNSVG